MSPVTGTPEATQGGAPKYTKKDFESDQDVRWCPGCGDYAILSAVQKMMPDLGQILRQYRRVLVPEINSGQLVRVLRAEYLVDAVGYNRVSGMPLASQDILEAINQLVEAKQ